MAQQIEHIKWIHGTNFMVDGFNFQNPKCKNYFLTHFHSDHTTGLNRSFSSGVVYCSPITATLLIKDMGMPAERVIPLPVDEPHIIDGVTVTLMDANHCPGACMMLFKVPFKGSKPQMILHCGDMRWQPRLADHPALKACKVDILYMDTTYCSPKHVFPSQDNAIASLVKVMREAYAEERKTLFVVGSYHIGKERAFLGAAKALDFKIWCHQAKKKVMEWCEMPAADLRRIVSKESAAQIHVVFMGQGLQPEALEQRRLKGDYARVVAFRPTGWSFQKKGLQTRREGKVTIYGIPYSEHSSFAELRNCVKLLRPKRLIPTVNCPDAASARAIVDRFADLMDLSRDKSRLDSYFGRTASAPACSPPSVRNPAGSKGLLAFQRESLECSSASAAHTAQLPPSAQVCCSLAGQDMDDDAAELLNGLACNHQTHPHGAAIKTENVATMLADSNCSAVKTEDTRLEGAQTDCDRGPACHGANAAAQGWADDDQDESCSPLPLQNRPGFSHAYSAPAALEQSQQHDWDDASEADLCSPVCSPADCSTQQTGPNSVQRELHENVQRNAACIDLDHHNSRACFAEPCSAGTALAAKTYPDMVLEQDSGGLYKPVVVASEGPVCMLDSIDVAEQTRILSQIQQEALHARQCLPTKKRQLTLGCFVAPKRVK